MASRITRTASQTLMLSAALLLVPPSTQAELRYTCAQLGDMAKQFHALRLNRYSLEDVLAGIHKGAADNPEKEKLLSELAIEVYIDPAVETAQQANALGRKRCAETRR
jgi:nicotinamide mononucleotide adenylyltransferase